METTSIAKSNWRTKEICIGTKLLISSVLILFRWSLLLFLSSSLVPWTETTATMWFNVCVKESLVECNFAFFFLTFLLSVIQLARSDGWALAISPPHPGRLCGWVAKTHTGQGASSSAKKHTTIFQYVAICILSPPRRFVVPVVIAVPFLCQAAGISLPLFYSCSSLSQGMCLPLFCGVTDFTGDDARSCQGHGETS